STWSPCGGSCANAWPTSVMSSWAEPFTCSCAACRRQASISPAQMMRCWMRWTDCSRKLDDTRSPCRSELAREPRPRNMLRQQAVAYDRYSCRIEAAPMSDLFDLPLGPLERAFVASLQRLDPKASESLLLAAALCCEALGRGDVCLPLARFAGRRPWPESDVLLPPL